MKGLLVSMGFLGDLVLSTACVRSFALCHPDAELSVLTTPLGCDVYQGLEGVNDVIVFNKRTSHRGPAGLFRFARELRKRNFDIVYSVHRSFRTALLLRLAGISERIGFRDAVGSVLYSKRVRYEQDATHYVLKQLSVFPRSLGQLDSSLHLPQANEDRVPKERYAVIAPGSVWPTKMWHWRNFADVAKQLHDSGLRVVLVGSEHEQSVAGRIAAEVGVLDCTGTTSLAQLFGLIEQSSLVLCNDSAVLHVASVYQRPTVAVFCATTPSFGFGPWQNANAEVVEKPGLYCKPCRRHGSRRCPNGTELCMRGLSADEVYMACKRVLARAASSNLTAQSRLDSPCNVRQSHG